MSRTSFISVYESISGWKAVQYWWNAEHGGFWEPWQTGIGSYQTYEEAYQEAMDWAESEHLECQARWGKPSKKGR